MRPHICDTATRAGARVAVVTAAHVPDLDPDNRLVLGPLAGRGITAEPVVWDDPDVDWAAYSLAVIRSTWDYAERRGEFVAWAATVPRLVNPADVIAWNTDKRYLAELANRGIPTVETDWVAPTDGWLAPDSGEWVVKPAVGAGSIDAGRYDLAVAEHRELAEEHLARLRRAGRLAMVQPYLSAVDTEGETALLFFTDPATGDLAFSHAIRKAAMLAGPDRGAEAHDLPEKITRRSPSAAQREAAGRVLAAVPGGTARLLYARVDLLPGSGGVPVLVELELAEPSLFLAEDPAAPERFAAAVAAHLARTA